MEPLQRLSGTIERVTFHNDETGYTVLKITPDQRRIDAARDGTVTVVGIMPELMPGENVEFTGKWVEDKMYGRQFRAETVAALKPSSINGIVAYLSSGLVKGIGPSTAEKIVSYFGTSTLDVLDREPDRVYDVPGLKRELATRLKEAWARTTSARAAMIFLQGYGITPRTATRIHKQYGEGTVDTVKADPYTLARDVFGIGFIKADDIAKRMGVAPDAIERIRAGLDYALTQMANEGHVYLPKAELMAKAGELLKVEDLTRIEVTLNGQIKHRVLEADRVVQPGAEAVYLPLYYNTEVQVARRLRALADGTSSIITGAKKTNWQTFLANLSKGAQIQLSAQQQDAVRAALTHKISVLTGGPGTGKTTTLRMVIEALRDRKFRFALASPTGRAAKRLSESTGQPAYTIHRLLGYNPVDGWGRNEDQPLDVEMLIIDEASMVDLLLMHQVLKALKPETHLMLVGDINQLPSVGAGNVLRDVIDSGIAHVTRLETIFRQESDSHIIVNAHRVNSGDDPYMDNASSDFFFFRADEPDECATMIIDVVRNRIPAKFGVDPLREVQVIAPMYRGAAGVDALNDALQAALNPGGRGAYKMERTLYGKVFRAGDKVMQTKNNYEKEVFNGDIGQLHGIDPEENVFQVMMDDGNYVEYEADEVDQLRHAYCISTHRSQGSEYPIVVIPVVTQHYMMLQRNLLYTAITRAKRAVILVGSRRAVTMAVENNRVSARYSGLLARLRAAGEG